MAEPKYKQYILDFRLSDGTTHSIPLKVPFGEPGKDGITPHIGANGNWFIGEKDTGISAGGSGGYVAQDAPPEDTSVLWIDTDDNSDDGFQEAVNYALAQAKASGEFDGDDYVLTDDDRNEIAELAAGLVEVPDAQIPLIGTTAEVTPTEVAVAITNGRPVIISAEDGENGAAFNNFHMVGNLDSATVVSTIIAPITQQGKTFHVTVTLMGTIPGNQWNLIQEDITEGGGISVTGATVGQTVTIAKVDEKGKPTAWEPTDFPSDEHINGLINTALGVIENGTY